MLNTTREANTTIKTNTLTGNRTVSNPASYPAHAKKEEVQSDDWFANLPQSLKKDINRNCRGIID